MKKQPQAAPQPAPAADPAPEALRPDQKLRRTDNGISKDQMAVQLPPNCFQEAEFQYMTWAATIPTGIARASLMEPGFWALYAPKAKPFHEIRATAEDGTWMARFIVLEVGRTWLRLQELEHHNLGTQDVSLTKTAKIAVEEAKKNFTVQHRGPKGWSVLRNSDRQVMHEGAQSKGAAETWLDGHLKTSGAGEAVAV